MSLLRSRTRVLACVSLVLLLLLSLGGLVLQNRLATAVAATEQVQMAVARGDVAAACAAIGSAAAHWDKVSTLTQPFAPLLRRLHWIPSLGADLALAPDVVNLAQHSAAAGAVACDVFMPAVAVTPRTAQVAQIVERLQSQPDAFSTIREHLKKAETAWTAISPRLDSSSRLRPYRQELERVAARLPRVNAVLASIDDAQPYLPWLLGSDAPRRYLLVLQNPFELRPTGGFIGMLCVVRVADAAPTVEQCQPSEAYTTPAPANMPLPLPYSRYLRLNQWFLRDANWSPDLATSAQTLLRFWELNGQAPVDGVIAVDPYALAPLLQATGPVTLPDGTRVDANTIIDHVLQRYYDGATYRDKAGLGALLHTIVQHVTTIEPASLPNVLHALDTSVKERHVAMMANHLALAEVLQADRWNGVNEAGSTTPLRVVDADVGYGAVNAFVERLTHYDLALDDAATPLTATLTLTYTNSYSPWAEAPTSFAVNGQCTDPQTLVLEHHTGCYANYLRVYVPHGSQLLTTSGLEETLGVDQEGAAMVFGGYFRVFPGQQHVVQLRYRLPVNASRRVVIVKQPGTLKSPLLMTTHSQRAQTAVYATGQQDAAFTLSHTAQGILIDGTSDANATAMFAQHTAFNRGLQLWQGGEQAQAVHTWKATSTLDRVLDYAQWLAAIGRSTEATSLTAMIAEVAPDGRAAFEQGVLLAAQGDNPGANALFEQAARRSPEHPLAQLVWAAQQAKNGAAVPSLSMVMPESAAVRRWRAAAEAYEQARNWPEALAHVAVLAHLMPSDRALALRHADLLVLDGQREDAQEHYAVLAADDDLWGRIAKACGAQLNDDRAQAVEQYHQALLLTTTYTTAMRVADELRSLGDQAGAIKAYERAASFDPASIWPLIAAGDLLRGTDATAAEAWYIRAQQVNGASGYPDYALGTLWMANGALSVALPLLEAAVAKQPENVTFQEALTQLQAQLR